MVLTFRSTTPEERFLIQRGRNGERVRRAVQASGSERTWDIVLKHPDGMRWNATYHGDGHSVGVAMAQLMLDKEHEKPPAPVRDRNIAIDEAGNAIGGAPIRKYM